MAEEIEDAESTVRFAIESQLGRLLLHLLKLRYGTSPRPRRGWRVTVTAARYEIAKRATGSLQHHPARDLPAAYHQARVLALAFFPEP